MKIKINIDYVVDILNALDDPIMLTLPLAVRKPLMLASAAQSFEDMFQDMLIQVPEMLKAEVVSVEEYDND